MRRDGKKTKYDKRLNMTRDGETKLNGQRFTVLANGTKVGKKLSHCTVEFVQL
jgi:archaellum component FlaF (FlaF/FlaG flagellin family)